MTNLSCAECLACHRTDEGAYECRRYPPVPLLVTDDDGNDMMVSEYPHIDPHGDDGCMEFKPREGWN